MYLEKSDCEMSIDKSDLCFISTEQPCQTALMLYKIINKDWFDFVCEKY